MVIQYSTYLEKNRINSYSIYIYDVVLDYVLMDKRLMGKLLNVYVFIEVTDMSDHYLVVPIARIKCRWSLRTMA